MQNKTSVIIKGTILSIILCLILSSALALLVSNTDIYGKSESALTFLVTVISVMAGAFAVARATGRRGLLSGLILSLLYYIIMFGIALIINGKSSLGGHTLLMFIATLLSGIAGGVIGMPR
ncbi:MAG: TIGR04086 family membrane protein [Clostridia bacterium]|nr:TIGR04086 family membrane protein [Clostridia bacterium]